MQAHYELFALNQILDLGTIPLYCLIDLGQKIGIPSEHACISVMTPKPLPDKKSCRFCIIISDLFSQIAPGFRSNLVLLSQVEINATWDKRVIPI